MSFVFYDVETTGVHKHFDQILQFAAILTDPDLNEIDRFEVRCRLMPHVVPSPGALRVTRIGMERLLDPTLPSHYEMVCEIAGRLSAWSRAVFLGWNTLEFDEELLRQAFWQCLHPPYLTNTNGNARTDLLRVAQALAVDEPDVLVVPLSDKGKPSFKLDRLAPANGFTHANAHDALADVEATVHIARIVMERAPDHWSEVLRFCSKASAVDFMECEDAFIVTECYFGKPYRYALTAIETESSGAVVAYDLSVDPEPLRDLDDARLAARLGRSPKPVRRVRANKSPLLRDIASVGGLVGMSVAELEERARDVRADEVFVARLLAASASAQFEEAVHVEARIYDGFPGHADQQRMRHFHDLCWQGRAKIVEEFEDQRLIELGRRLVYHHDPDRLCSEHLSDLEMSLTRRMLGHGHDDPKWLTLAAALEEAEVAKNGCSPEEEVILDGLIHYLRGEITRCGAIIN